MTQAIPCTVAMLTFNSGATLARALASVADVAEVVIADGGSTDDTVAIARRFNRTVVRQDPSCQDGAGRLVDYGAAREQLRQLATQPWILELDSDEYATDSLVQDLRRVCGGAGEMAWYTIAARYEVDGMIVDCATTYPMRRARLYRKSASSGYVGLTHEKPIVHGDLGELTSWYVVPVPPTSVVVRKWVRYLKLDVGDAQAMPPEKLLSQYRHQRSQLRWFVRDLWKKQIQATCQHRLPMHHELLRGVFYIARFGVFAQELARRRMGRHHSPDQVTVD